MYLVQDNSQVVRSTEMQLLDVRLPRRYVIMQANESHL